MCIWLFNIKIKCPSNIPNTFILVEQQLKKKKKKKKNSPVLRITVSEALGKRIAGDFQLCYLRGKEWKREKCGVA